MGIAVMLVTVFAMKETITRDVRRIRPAALMRSYGALLSSGYFMFSSLVVAGTSGAIYAQATVLPFVLINRVGLTPTQFGAGMLMQTGSYLLGSLIVRRLMPRFGAFAMVPVGLVCVAAGSLAIGILLRVAEPTYLSVMAPVGLFALGIAFAMPAMMTAAMAQFPRNAGAASALMGFLQMGTGLVGGLACALLGDPVHGLATVVPALGVIAIVSWLLWRRLPEPAAHST
jgi:DHA1 family bicyclomycin/chloramphenicol resistance-like MFS transporter